MLNIKKIIIVFIIVIAVIFIAGGLTYVVGMKNIRQSLELVKNKFIPCEDSDGGKDYYKMGTAVGFYNKQNTKQGATDICTLNGSRVESCVLGDKKIGEQGCRVREMYCQKNELMYEYYECPNVCENGACIK